MPIKSNLEMIKRRYFRPVIANQNGLVVHHGDCDIYRSMDHYGFAACNCGLIYDLARIDYTFAERIFPKFSEDSQKELEVWDRIENSGRFKKPLYENKPTAEEINQMFVSMGLSPPCGPKMETDEKPIWSLIQDVFGEQAMKDMKLRYEEHIKDN